MTCGNPIACGFEENLKSVFGTRHKFALSNNMYKNWTGANCWVGESGWPPKIVEFQLKNF